MVIGVVIIAVRRSLCLNDAAFVIARPAVPGRTITIKDFVGTGVTCKVA
jgi:hypothetical protein